LSGALFDAVSRIARHEAAARPAVAVGVVVDSFDGGGSPPDHAVSVELRETGIVLPRVPIAVGALGFAAIPDPGDLVVVAFADADYHAPLVLGRLYHADLSPPEHSDGEIVLHLPPGDSAPSFRASIRGGTPQLEVQLGDEVSIEVTADTVRLTAGDAQAVLEAGGGGRAELTVGEATFTLTGRGDIEISTPGSFKVSATDIELKGSASAKITAPRVEVN
jgi:hypothetical protein